MTEIQFLSDVNVELVQQSVSDQMVIQAARVSTGLGEVVSSTRDNGLIRFLMANRHGSPFEHGSMTFKIDAPIFVWREFMRHRIGFSYNEESGRYKELEPKFYIPGDDRKLVQQGKAGSYTFVHGNDEQREQTQALMQENSREAFWMYRQLLDSGVAREVARMVLPLNIFSSAFVTCNPRSLMAFLSLRTAEAESKFPSYPQKEIEMVARKMQGIWQDLMPLTSTQFFLNGRVAP